LLLILFQNLAGDETEALLTLLSVVQSAQLKPRCCLGHRLQLSGARLDAGNCVASRLFPQQIPGFLVLTVL
jgi:hypothetical protein